ncbi:MAG: hypothetical protein JWN94_3803 [Betaproteobacteria bacterium]|nr:hypothetical protein [Betaproteobacteria bacterium]
MKSRAMDADTDKDQPAIAYADEILCANWHPLVLMLTEPLTRVRKTLDTVDAENLLVRLYSSQEA